MAGRQMIALRYDVRMEAGSDRAEVCLYGKIIEDMPEGWKWSHEDKSAADFRKAILKAREDGAKKLRLRINSPGGIASEAVAMRSILADAGFDEITVRIEGICASAATVPASMPGVQVEIFEGSDYMIHNPWTIGWGEAADFEHVAQRLRADEEKFCAMYVARTGQDEATVRSWMDNETWFSAEEAVKYGFADKVVHAGDEENSMPVMACAAPEMMRAAASMYKHAPQRLLAAQSVSRGPEPTEEISTQREEEDRDMEIREVTQEMLRSGNPEVYAAIVQEGAQGERERLQEIEELTPPGYEEMAAQARAEGTSAMEYHKMIVRAQKQKGADFLMQRAEEVKGSAQVTGGATDDHDKTDKERMDAFAKEMAGYAKDATSGGGMY